MNWGVISETVSEHLRVLRNCELISDRREGNHVIYSVNRPDVIQKLFDILPDLHRNEDDKPNTYTRTYEYSYKRMFLGSRTFRKIVIAGLDPAIHLQETPGFRVAALHASTRNDE